MEHSDLENPIEGTGNGATDPAVVQIAAALNQGDYDSAGNLLREALSRSPEDKQLLRLAAKQRKQAERFTRVHSLLEETRQAMEEDEFVRAVGAYREAANLSQGFDDLAQKAFEVGVEEAKELGERNWRIARTLLEDAGRLNTKKLVVPEQLWNQIRAAEKEETIANVLDETALAKPAELGRARERLVRALEQYPEDNSLANRLRSIESTIEDKRRWDERQKALKKLTDLRDAMQRETEPSAVHKYIAQAELLANSYSSEAEFRGIVEDIRHQVMSCDRADVALKENRIDDCLEECAWVLSRMRHHQVFLNLKQQAEAREVAMADQYSDSVSEIKSLLAAGNLVDAETLCAKASAALPQFADLQELKHEIANRRLKEDKHGQETAENVRRLMERGERSLRENQFRAAEQSFSAAMKLQPDDKKLTGHVVGLLHGYARSNVKDSAQYADEAVQMAVRLLPGTTIPADLAEAIPKARAHMKDEQERWAALDRIGGLNAQLESAKNQDEIDAVRAEAQNFSSTPHIDVKEAALALREKALERKQEIEIKRARRPGIYRALSIAATLLLGVGLAYWMNGSHPNTPVVEKKKPAMEVADAKAVTAPKAVPEPAAPAPAPAIPDTGSLIIRSEVPGVQVAVGDKQYTTTDQPLKVELNANSYQVTGSRPGYKDFGPVTVAVGKAAETVLDVKLMPKPGSVEIEDLDKDTRIKIDGTLMTKHKSLNKQLEAGEHNIEVLRNGVVAKSFTQKVDPGQAVVLSAADWHLDSPPKGPEVAVATPPPAAPPVAKPSADEVQWQTVNKNDADSLRAFIGKYHDSPRAGEAKRQLDGILEAREDSDWSSTDRNNRNSLLEFLKKYPEGRHASVASSSLADVERKSRIAETQSTEEAAWKRVNRRDEASIEGYLHDFPSGRYKNQAETDLAAIRTNRTSASESAAVLSVISRLANAWSAKDLDSILAIQRNLNKREVKAELANVKQLAMTISPASPPQIEGTQAVVLCRRQTSQTFSDGTHKQIPESVVSYVLSKHDGNWTIEGTK